VSSGFDTLADNEIAVLLERSLRAFDCADLHARCGAKGECTLLTRSPGRPQENVTTGTPTSRTADSARGSDASTKLAANGADVFDRESSRRGKVIRLSALGKAGMGYEGRVLAEWSHRCARLVP
jgi:hypothetical protein